MHKNKRTAKCRSFIFVHFCCFLSRRFVFHSENLKCLKMEKTLNLLCMTKIEEHLTLFLRAIYFLLLDRVVILCKKRGGLPGRHDSTFFEKGGSQLRLITVKKTEKNQSCIGSHGSTENKIKRGVVTYDMGTRI